jgi:hypothetical protein
MGVKTEPPKGKKEVSNDSRGKSDTLTPCNLNIKCFRCLGICHIAFQCQNKKGVILRDHREVKTKSDNNDYRTRHCGKPIKTNVNLRMGVKMKRKVVT